MTRAACGAGWAAPPPGPQTLRIRNAAAVTMEVELVDPATGTVFGELDGVGTGTTRALPVDLGNGRTRCDARPRTGYRSSARRCR